MSASDQWRARRLDKFLLEFLPEGIAQEYHDAAAMMLEGYRRALVKNGGARRVIGDEDQADPRAGGDAAGDC